MSNIADAVRPQARVVDEPFIPIRGASPVTAETPTAPVSFARTQGFLRTISRTRVTGWLLLVLIIVAWQVKAEIDFNPSIQSPAKVVNAWISEVQRGEMLTELWVTLRTMLIGNSIAVPLGVGLGFVMGRSRFVWGLFEPLTEIIRLTPVSAILPIYILFLGLGDQFQIAVFLTAGLFPMVINSYAGARAVPKALSETALTYRLTWLETQREIALPFALPFIIVGLRQSVAHSLVLAVIIGMLAGNSGIGYYLLEAQQAFDVQRVLAVVLTVAVLGYFMNAFFVVLERRVQRQRGGSLHD